METVRFANPAWATTPEFLVAKKVELGISPLSLLVGCLHVTDAMLEDPVLDLERNAKGRSTWQFDRHQRDKGAAPVVDTLRVDHGELDYHDALTDAILHASFRNAMQSGSAIAAHADPDRRTAAPP